MINKLEFLKEFWAKKNDPLHPIHSEEESDKYYKEVLFHVYGHKTIVDAGCGSGEITVRLAKDFEKVIGIDFSESMVQVLREKIAKDNINNVEVYVDDVLNINKLVKEKVDVVLNSAQIQYVNIQQAETFIANSKEILKDDGIIVLLFVLNANLEYLYYSGLFRDYTQKLTLNQLIKKLMRFSYTVWKEKIKDKNYEYSKELGFWHYTSDYIEIAKRLDLNIEFFQSFYPPYGYRFNVKLSKKNKL